MPKKILLVDDSKTMRDMERFTLQQAGYVVAEAGNSADALTLVETENFDLVITDINMPGMNGIELVGELRKRPNCKAVPIIVLSTESEAGLKNEARQAGATGWIVKPFRPEALVKVVRKVCL